MSAKSNARYEQLRRRQNRQAGIVLLVVLALMALAGVGGYALGR